jgi:hypothetical protein
MNLFTRKKTRKEQTAALRLQGIKIHTELLALDLDEQQMTDFWEDCHIHGEINHVLPACSCGDVNQCETWCRPKARFQLDPPD